MTLRLTFYILNFHFLPPLQGQHASCQEISYSKREAKFKKEEKQKTSPLGPLSCSLGHIWTSILQRLHIAFPLTNPCHLLLSWTFLLACLISKPLYFKHSFTVSIHLFHGLPAERLPAHTTTDTIGDPIPLHMAKPL